MGDRQTRGVGFGQTPVIHSGAPQRDWRSGIAVWGSGMRKLERKKRKPRAAKTWEGLLCIGVMLVVLGVGNGVLGLNNKVLLMAALLADVALAVRCGWSWNDLAPVMCRKIGAMAVMFLIFCGIGFVTGSWMVSGTIPVLAGKLVMLIRPNDVLWMAFLMLDQHHFEQHHRVYTGPSVILTIQWRYHFINAVKIHCRVYFRSK